MSLEESIKHTFLYEPLTGKLFRKLKTGVIRETGLKRNPYGYLRTGFNRKVYHVHRVVWFLYYGIWPNGEVDHINGIKHDNRIENLRVVNKAQNQANRKNNKNSKSKYKGVYPHRNKWAAAISFNKVRYFLGLFGCETSAALAYDQAANKLNDKFRKRNF